GIGRSYFSANPNSFSAADIFVSYTGRSDFYDRYKPSALNRPNRQYFFNTFPHRISLTLTAAKKDYPV
ncbi:MAG: hypothetical protein VX930_03975, partial [Pseudomonadota bacterium]|nr:hypothetical protein [Pseudomonadota bacterium]